jgi:hypothetical protein
MSEATESKRFPWGGSRQAVYDFLMRHGFNMSRSSDKSWARYDGVTLHIYGAGSMAQIRAKDGTLIADEALEAAMDKLKVAS